MLPFALKVAADRKADKALRDQMFGVVETIGGLEAEKGLVAHHLVRQGRDRPLPRLRVDAGGAQGGGDPAGAGGVPRQRDLQEGRRRRSAGKLIEKLGDSARPALVKTLDSRASLARMTAVMALGEVGRAPDATALDKFAGGQRADQRLPRRRHGRQGGRARAEDVRKKS